MTLLCALGFHRPAGIPRWNDGFYFAACQRCGRDIVRTAYQRWHVPAGFKVVWSAAPPEDRPDVAIVDTRGAETPPPAPAETAAAQDAPTGPQDEASAGEPEEAGPASEPPEAARREPDAGPRRGLPIEEVLAHLREEERSGGVASASVDPDGAPPSAAAEAAPVVAPSPPPPPSGRYWDFMDDEPGRIAPGGTQPAPPDTGAAGLDEETPAPPSRVAAAAASAGAALRRAGAPFQRAWNRPGGPHPFWIILFAMAVSAAIALATGAYFDRPAAPPPAASPSVAVIGSPADPFAAPVPSAAEPRHQPAAVAMPRQGARAFVAASLLSCRSAPAREARRVRSLSRGAQVDLLAQEGEWASIAFDGRQCWALARYVTPQPPY